MHDATRCPEDVLGWIPWYPDEGLTDAQRGAVEAHAADCVRCRDEIALVRDEVEVAEDPGVDPAFERLLARIRDAERSDHLAGPEVRRARAPLRRRSVWSSPPLRMAAGLAFAAVFLAAGKLADDAFFEAPASEPEVYESASAAAPAVPTGAEGELLDVVFRDDADARSIREALRSVNGQVISGPTEAGRYRVRLGAGADVRAVARALAAGDAGVAVYAEPAPR